MSEGVDRSAPIERVTDSSRLRDEVHDYWFGHLRVSPVVRDPNRYTDSISNSETPASRLGWTPTIATTSRRSVERGCNSKRFTTRDAAFGSYSTESKLTLMGRTRYGIDGLDLSDDEYTVEQNLVRNRYEAVDDGGNTVLEGKQKTFKLKEEFPFVDGNGEEVFTVNARQIRDYEGEYVLTDARSGDDVVVLEHEYSIFEQITGATWKICDAESGGELAEITSRKFVGLFRHGLLGNLIPHRYEITDCDGTRVGTISGRLSMKDRYDVHIADASTVPRELIVTTAIIIDAIEGN